MKVCLFCQASLVVVELVFSMVGSGPDLKRPGSIPVRGRIDAHVEPKAGQEKEEQDGVEDGSSIRRSTPDGVWPGRPSSRRTAKRNEKEAK